MKRVLALFFVFIILCAGAVVKTVLVNSDESVIIYTSMEQYAVELLQERLKEKFTDFDVEIVTKSTSDIATKVLEEGEGCEADIVFGLEYAYIEQLIQNDRIFDLQDRYDMSVFADDMVNDVNRTFIVPCSRSGVSIIVNNVVLQEKGLPKPTSFADLTNSAYKNAMFMPSPKSSGTGYAFYLAMVNLLGENEALNYFDEFAKNVVQFTTSGSAPVNHLIAREAAIGIGMISQAVEEISSGNKELEVIIAKEGAAYGSYASFVVKGKQSEAALKIMDYLYNEFTDECCAKYYPELIFKDKVYSAENYPKNLFYCDMSDNTMARKEELLRRWKY